MQVKFKEFSCKKKSNSVHSISVLSFRAFIRILVAYCILIHNHLKVQADANFSTELDFILTPESTSL